MEPASQQELAVKNSISQAREYAMKSQYETSITFYTGLLQEIDILVNSFAETSSQRSNWAEVRSKIEDEMRVVVELAAEWKAVINPADNVRHERNLQRGVSAYDAPPQQQEPQQNPYVLRDRRPVGGPPAAGGAYHSNNNHYPPGPQPGAYNDLSPPPAPQQYAQHGSPPQDPYYGGGGGGGGMDYGQAPVGMDLGFGPPPPIPGKPSRNAPPSVGSINEHLYGDKDRFAPPAPAPKASHHARPSDGPTRRSGGGPPDVPPAAPTNRKERSKPPLPKFGGKPAGAGAGQPAKPSAGAKAAANKRDVKPYVARPGEEEIVRMIEADMNFANTGTQFDDVAGQDEAKSTLEEAMMLPIMMPEYFTGIRRPWRGILLYGPPGTGKTMLAKAVAGECNTTFFNISPATLTSKWRGDSEKLVRVLFEMARHYAPSTIFIDEIDSIAGQRGGGDEHEASRRAKGTLLQSMDGVGVDTASNKVVVVLGATNHPWDIDEAMRRRLEKRIYIPLPSHNDRIELMKINTRDVLLGEDVNFEEVSRYLENRHCSGHDITNICRDAALRPMRRVLQQRRQGQRLRDQASGIENEVKTLPVTLNDFYEAIQSTPSSVDLSQLQKFEKWKAQFSGEGAA